MNQYQKLYTAQDSAIVFIDHQPQMTFGVGNMDRGSLINNVTLLAKVAREFNVPAVLTAVETESFSGYLWPQLLDVFPGQAVVERSSMNAWDDAGFRKAVELHERFPQEVISACCLGRGGVVINDRAELVQCIGIYASQVMDATLPKQGSRKYLWVGGIIINGVIFT